MNSGGVPSLHLVVIVLIKHLKMEGKDLEIYNRSLFKTINFIELKQELVLRSINFSPSDTYILLTLRLRKSILESLDIQHSVVESIDNEIKVYDQTKQRSGSGYSCSIPGCSFRCLRHKKYIHHLGLVHHNTKSRLVCQFRHDCSRDFATVNLLKTHIKRDHEKQLSSVAINQNQLVEEIVTLRCVEKSCSNQVVSNIVALKKHLLTHTNKKELVQCLFCDFKTNTSGTFKSHWSIKHKIQNVNSLNPNLVKYEEGDVAEIEENPEILEPGLDSYDNISDEEVLEEDHEDEEQERFDNEEVFIKALAITFNTWMNISGVSYTTVNAIVKEVFGSYEKGKDFTKMKLKQKLKDDQIEATKIEEILNVLEEDDPFCAARKELEMEKRRKRFILNKFPNVPPETIFLSSEAESRRETMQYVPITKSLKLLLEDQTYIKQKLEDPYNPEEDVIKDTRDGACFQENEFFQNNPDAVPLVVFQDELEICNPLGAAKTKHKINCTYFTALTVQPALRSKVQSIQLVSLVLSKYWKIHGNAKCNARFISDMKVLEEKGIKVVAPVLATVKAGLAYIVGDNLGQHNLSEISQSFSSGNICRWCKATYREVCKDGLCYSGCRDDFKPEKWTVQEYDQNADLAEENEEADTFGIKRHCTFNQLKSYHCVKQMPPCLGHDFFEGVYSYDSQFYLDQLINKEKLLDIETFNRKLKNVILSDRDSKNRPKDFKTRA